VASNNHLCDINLEYFASYDSVRWYAEQPLVLLHQWYEAGATTTTQRHMDFYALYIVRGGRGTHVIDGHPYPIVRGDVYLTPPGAAHSYRDYSALRAEAFCFQAELFSEQELAALRELPGFWRLFLAGDQVGGDYQNHLSPVQYAFVEAMLEELMSEMAVPTRLNAILVRGLLFRLLAYLARLPSATAAPAGRSLSRSPDLSEVIRLCEERFMEPLTVPQLAARLFLSPAYFSELFTRAVGMPPAAYLRQLRLEHAQTLLRTTTLPITEVAQQSGFGESSQLARAFRVAFGMTPSTYRRTFR
jgi:AraC-like DNA-binding protein